MGMSLEGTLRKVLSDCGIGISSFSKDKRDFTLHFAALEFVYSACVSFLHSNENKQPIPLSSVTVTLVSVYGFMWSRFVRLKLESQNMTHENVERSSGYFLCPVTR